MHLPPVFPMVADSSAPGLRKPEKPGPPMQFLAQFYCDPIRLPLDDTRCVQIYQCDPEAIPWPEVIRVLHGAPENTEGLGIVQPGVIPHDVTWEHREDHAVAVGRPMASLPSASWVRGQAATGRPGIASEVEERRHSVRDLVPEVVASAAASG
jgi:hypothetical protein